MALAMSLSVVASGVSAGMIEDVVDQKVYLNSKGKKNGFKTYTYTHILGESGEDPFAIGSQEVVGGKLKVKVKDDKKDKWWSWKDFEIGVLEINDSQGNELDSDWSIATSNFKTGLNLSVLAALNTDGKLDITIRALNGDFWVGDSILKLDVRDINTPDTAAVPEPSLLAMLGLGLFGLGVARKTTKSQATR